MKEFVYSIGGWGWVTLSREEKLPPQQERFPTWRTEMC